jgi:hypothetical protein
MGTLVGGRRDDEAADWMEASLHKDSGGGYRHRMRRLAKGQDPDSSPGFGGQLRQPGGDGRARIGGSGGSAVELSQHLGHRIGVGQT